MNISNTTLSKLGVILAFFLVSGSIYLYLDSGLDNIVTIVAGVVAAVMQLIFSYKLYK